MRLPLTLAMFALTAAARAQSPLAVPTVVVLDVALDNADALVKEPADSVSALIATTALRDTLSRFPRIRLVDAAVTAAAIGSPSARAAASGEPCNVVVPCALAVGKAVGARYVVIGKVSKSSALTWQYWGGLIDVDTGFQVISESSVLRGNPAVRVAGPVTTFAASINKQLNGGGI
jgi:Protein of unknown function (DUF2380)